MVIRLLIASFLINAGICSAQLRQLPIGHQESTARKSASSRIMEVQSIQLPFWDDFSTSQGSVDTTWWMPSSQVQVIANPGIGINPPTMNVATFDGVDATGAPYSLTGTDGPVDSLVSRPIDLTRVPLSLRNSVYLSFFFQIKGLGEMPESTDSLLLYFKHDDGSWEKVWPLASDFRPVDPTKFEEKILRVADASYFHPEFQFKFKAIGRQNGWFDNWNIDYVYLDKRRDANDNSFLDRAFTGKASSIFNDYTALPFDEFMAIANKAVVLSSPITHIMNLEQDIQPIEYSAILYDTLNKIELEKLADGNANVMFPRDLLETTTLIPNPSSFDINADSLFLEIEYSIDSGDKFLIDSIFNGGLDTVFYDNIDLRVNDTVRTYFSLHDYFAYDDGSAEFGAGLNQKNGKLAYQYIANTQNFIDRIDVYFPNIDRNQAGTPVEFFVLDDFEETSNSLLGVTSGSVQHTGINQLVSYHFNPSVLVQDTFYIGFTHLGIDGNWLAVGLDKNTDTSDRIFFNVDGSWVPNTNISGSLMMRPHFSLGIISGIEIQPPKINVYPNPTSGYVIVESTGSNVRVYDVLGREEPTTILYDGNRQVITFDNKGPRIVFLEIVLNNQRIVKKILITN